MILVLSYDAYEQGTDPVISWLLYYKVKFMRISLNDLLTKRVRYAVDLRTQDMLIEGVSVKEAISVVWHRRFLGELNQFTYQSGSHSAQLNAEVHTEVRDFVGYLAHLLKNKKWLTAFDKLKANKLEMLDLAASCGLLIPQTKVLNNKQDLLRFYAKSPAGLVSKPISDTRKSYIYEGDTYVILTNSFDEDRINALPEFFFPAVFQEKIAINFEIRTFYLDGRFFSTAFFNSNPEKSVDKKLDSSAETTHMLPYQLPAEVEDKLEAFMQKAGLNTGSLDILKDFQDNYIFLEVNPVGQFLAESEKCNYKLDKEIAEWLIRHDYV